MTIGELHRLIREHPVCEVDCIGWYFLGGCELLEHIVDVGGFVSLLRKFRKVSDTHRGVPISIDSNVGLVDDYPDPIRTILGGNVRFVAGGGVLQVDIFVGVGGVEFLYRCCGGCDDD